MIVKYSVAQLIVISDAPNKFIKGFENTIQIKLNIILIKIVIVIPVPTLLCAFSESFLPAQILKYDAAPSPIHHANALVIQIIGNDTPVAAFP